jgi:hypothetical protein
MAVTDDNTTYGLATALLLCGSALAGLAPTARAETASAGREAADVRVEPASTAARHWWREGASRMQGLLHEARRKARHVEPDWLRHRDANDVVDAPMSAADGGLCLVLQEGRPDGTDLVTARYTLHDLGALRTYAGAGLNRAQYFHDDTADPGPTLFNKRNRRTSMGAAAEFGAELRMSERMLLAADVRWADLADRAEALRTEHGPVAADPVSLGLSVGYRFR